MVFETGDTEMFFVQETFVTKRRIGTFFKEKTDCPQTIYRVKCDKDEEHETQVTFLTVHERTGCFMTGSKDGVVKVWNREKKLIFDFQFFSETSSGIFSGSGYGMLLAQKKVISDIKPTVLDNLAKKYDPNI